MRAGRVLARLPGEGLIGELLHPEKLLLHGWLGGRGQSCKIDLRRPDPPSRGQGLSSLDTDDASRVALTLAHPPRLPRVPRRVRAAAVDGRGTTGGEGVPSCRGKGERPS